MISKFRQREKISTTINHFNDVKRKWKEQEIEKITKKVSAMAHNHEKKAHKAVHFH